MKYSTYISKDVCTLHIKLSFVFLWFGISWLCPYRLLLFHWHLWQTIMSDPISFLNSSLGLGQDKHYHPWISLPNLLLPGRFPYILWHPCHLSLLSSVWVVIVVYDSISIHGICYWLDIYVCWHRDTISNESSSFCVYCFPRFIKVDCDF